MAKARQMMIIAVLYRRHAKQEGGVYARHVHYVCVSVQNEVCTCCAYVGKREKGFV